MALVPFEDFVKFLVADGEASILHTWLEFYQKEDSVYKIFAGYLRNDTVYMQDEVAFLEKSCAKLKKWIPDLPQICPDPVDSLRQDFDFALEHALEIFGRGKEKFKKILDKGF